MTDQMLERLAALGIPAVDDYLAGRAKGRQPAVMVRLLEGALAGLITVAETALLAAPAAGVPDALSAGDDVPPVVSKKKH